MSIIAALKGKSKALLSRISVDWVIVAIILLSSSAAFGLGYLAGKDAGEKEELEIIYPEQAEKPGDRTSAANEALGGIEGQYVASKTGKSYHLPWCSGAKLIKEGNKIWFASKEEAEARGYAPAGNCPGI